MKFNFNLSKKIALGYIILLLFVFAAGLLSYKTLAENRKTSENLINTTVPSVAYMHDLYVLIDDSKMLIKNWVFIEELENTPSKNKLKKLPKEYRKIKDILDELSVEWSASEAEKYSDVTKLIGELFKKQADIMAELKSVDNYKDLYIVKKNKDLLADDGAIMLSANEILMELGMLLKGLEKKSTETNIAMIKTFDDLKKGIELTRIVIILLGFLIAMLTIKSIVTPINRFKNTLFDMSKGILPAITTLRRNDEIGKMTEALSEHVLSLKRTSEFAKEIGTGNFETDFKPLSNSDILGNALIDMRENLEEANKTEKERQKEDDQRNWGNKGLAMFGDILRKNNDNINDLSYDIVSNLVKYLNANQGGVFVIENENGYDLKDTELHMTAAYAYNRRKFADKVIRYGEGLIGTCFVEKHSIYMSEMPDSYLNITSGLGKSNPRYLLLVPLMVNENVYGVIEIASFYKIEKYQIEFTEKIAESIATTISSVKINTRTARLLEESKMQSEQLIQQEEEMRQNLEELQATQEESHRKLKELQTQLDQVNDYIGVYELDFEGNMTYVNDYFADLIGENSYDLTSENINTIITSESELKEFMEYFDDFSKGIRKTGTRTYTNGEESYKMMESYIPKRSEYGDFERVMIFSIKEEDLKESE